MKHTVFSLKDKHAWFNALVDIPHSYAHVWAYNKSMSISTSLDIHLHVFEDQGLKVVIPLAVRKKEERTQELVSPYGFGGFAGDNSLLTSELLRQIFYDICYQENYITVYIMQHPLFLLSKEVWGSSLEEGRDLYSLDLSIDEKDLWKGLAQSHRYELKKFNRDLMVPTIITDKEQLRGVFKKIYKETLVRVHAADVYYFADETLDILINSQDTFLIGVKEEGEIRAISMFLIASENVEYFLNATKSNARHLARYILWFAITYFKEMGMRYFHLGGGIKSGDTLEAFKRRFGGVHHKTQVIKIILDTNKYRELCVKYFCDDKKDSDYFPTYWIPTASNATATSALI